jgi:hypothetical protein
VTPVASPGGEAERLPPRINDLRCVTEEGGSNRSAADAFESTSTLRSVGCLTIGSAEPVERQVGVVLEEALGHCFVEVGHCPTGCFGEVPSVNELIIDQDRQQHRTSERAEWKWTGLSTGRLWNGKTQQQAHDAVEDARTFTPTAENPTDLASIPRYMRWFETSYGAHTLAAIIHDDLILDEPNAGPLEDDTLSDRFFREMTKSAGVPWLKRWIMWSAVALRTRWAVGGVRRLSVLVWLLLSATGIISFVWAVGSATFGWDDPVDSWALLVVALVLPFVAAFLWGKQYGASIVAAIAALWILPAAALAGLGYLVYLGLERAADLIGLD